MLLWTCSLCTTRRNWRVSVRPGTLGISCLSHWVRGCTRKIWKHSRCLPVSASVSCLEHNWIQSALTPDTALLYPDSVNDYFGNPLAYYFSFLDFYTWSLLPPAVLGLVITYFSGRCEDKFIWFQLYCIFCFRDIAGTQSAVINGCCVKLKRLLKYLHVAIQTVNTLTSVHQSAWQMLQGGYENRLYSLWMTVFLFLHNKNSYTAIIPQSIQIMPVVNVLHVDILSQLVNNNCYQNY